MRSLVLLFLISGTANAQYRPYGYYSPPFYYRSTPPAPRIIVQNTIIMNNFQQQSVQQFAPAFVPLDNPRLTVEAIGDPVIRINDQITNSLDLPSGQFSVKVEWPNGKKATRQLIVSPGNKSKLILLQPD